MVLKTLHLQQNALAPLTITINNLPMAGAQSNIVSISSQYGEQHVANCSAAPPHNKKQYLTCSERVTTVKRKTHKHRHICTQNVGMHVERMANFHSTEQIA